MTSKFAWLCELPNELESKKNNDLNLFERGSGFAQKTTQIWFAEHQHAIAKDGPAAVAFLLALLPER